MEPAFQSISLVATIGISPAVLTEAYYTLHQEKRLLPKKIIIITTQTGREKIRKELLDSATGQMSPLFRDLKVSLDSYPEISVKVPECDGVEITDIRNKSEDEAFASLLISELRNLTHDDANPVYGLLSGGRKTMSAHLHSVFQLMGRPQDRLIHVLVPPEYEVAKFYYPQNGKYIESNGRRIHSGDARIEMVESPFIALRNLIKPPLDFSRPFSELVMVARKRLGGSQYPVKSLFIDLSSRQIFINDNEKPVRLSPRPLSIFAFFAFLNVVTDKVCAFSYRSLSENIELLDLLMAFYKFITNKDMEEDPWFKFKKGRMVIQDESNLFARSRSELIKMLSSGLKEIGEKEIGGLEVFINNRITNRDNASSANKLLVPGTAIMFKEEEFIQSLREKQDFSGLTGDGW